MSSPQDVPGAGAAGVSAGGGDQGATFEGETTGPGGDTSPAVVDGAVDPNLSPDVARAAAAEVEPAELGDAATAGLQAPGGESAPDPK
jgi:hypothetical protein